MFAALPSMRTKDFMASNFSLSFLDYLSTTSLYYDDFMVISSAGVISSYLYSMRSWVFFIAKSKFFFESSWKPTSSVSCNIVTTYNMPPIASKYRRNGGIFRRSRGFTGSCLKLPMPCLSIFRILMGTELSERRCEYRYLLRNFSSCQS